MPPRCFINLDTSALIGLFLASFISLTPLYTVSAQDLTNIGTLTTGALPALSVNSITNVNTATLNTKGNLTVQGNFTNDGIFTANTSTVDFTGTTTQNIQGSAIDDQFHNLSITNGTGSVVLNKDILIKGNLTNDGTLNANGKKVTLNGGTLQTVGGISATGNTFYNLTIANTNAGIKLSNNIGVTNQLSINDGDIDLNGNDVDLGTVGAIVNETDDKRIHGSAGNIIARDRDLGPVGDYNNIAGMGIDLQVSSGGNTPGITTIKRSYANYTASVDRSFDISATTSDDLKIIMTFHYFENEVNDAEEDLTVYRSADNGATWTDHGGVVNPSLNHVVIDSITAFSIWSASKKSSPPGPLPIDLLDFSATVEGPAVRLDWTTVSETNNDYFTIERSPDGLTFDVVTTVVGAGNSNTKLFYTTYDEDPLPGLSYYRLRQTDFDGSFSYSQIVSAQFSKQASAISVFPNPVRGTQLTLSGKYLDAEEIRVTLINTLGEIVYATEVFPQHNTLLTTIDLNSTLKAGLYLIIGTGKNEIFKEPLIFIE